MYGSDRKAANPNCVFGSCCTGFVHQCRSGNNVLESSRSSLDRLADEAAQPLTFPDHRGEWQLNDLRWRILQRLIRAEVGPGVLATAADAASSFTNIGLSLPQRLSPAHSVSDFDCRSPKLNARLSEAARQVTGREPLKQEGLRVDVVTSDTGAVIAYVTHRPVQARCAASPDEAPIALLLIPSLAVDYRWRAPNVARSLIAHILQQALGTTAEIDVEGVIAFAIDQRVKGLFKRCGGRPMGEVIHPRAMFLSKAEFRARAASSGNRPDRSLAGSVPFAQRQP